MDPTHQPPRPREDAQRPDLVGRGLDRIHLVRWSDPIVDARGYDPRSRYVETFWLPVLGPSATLLLRRFAMELEMAPSGVELDTDALARGLGLGVASGRRSPFRRALARCIRFGAARTLSAGTLAVRRRLAPVPTRHIAALPIALQDLHRTWPRPAPDICAPAAPTQPTGCAGSPMALRSHASSAPSESAPT